MGINSVDCSSSSYLVLLQCSYNTDPINYCTSNNDQATVSCCKFPFFGLENSFGLFRSVQSLPLSLSPTITPVLKGVDEMFLFNQYSVCVSVCARACVYLQMTHCSRILHTLVWFVCKMVLTSPRVVQRFTATTSGGHSVTLVLRALLPRQSAISLDTMTMSATYQELSEFVFASPFQANI